MTLKNLSNYSIKEDGTVYSKLKNRNLKGLTKEYGYRTVYLKHDDNTSRWYYVHRLVAMAYIPNPDNKPEIHHKD
jgi:hypothetical protein